MNEIYMMVIITNRSMREIIRAFFQHNDLTVTLSALGYGTASSAVLDYLGLEATEKAAYFSFVTGNTWKKIKRKLLRRLRIDAPGRGIAFTVPMSSIGGRGAISYLTAGQELTIEEESTMKDTAFELLVIIANNGYSDVIMDAARGAKAPGGTVIHAKGTGMEQAKKYLGVTLTEEKDMIFIVVRSSQKNAIMRAIMDQAGASTKAGAVVFSLPVTDAAGLTLSEEPEEETEE